MSLLLTGARIVGGSDAQPVDVLLKHGVVVGIGQGLSGSATLDLGGRYLLPGLWENHAHLTQLALTRRRADVSGATSAAEAAAVIAAAPRPHGDDPIVGFGFRDGLWDDEPTVELLDAAAGDVPVVIVSGDLHCCWLNTAALRRFAPGRHEAVLREDDAFPVTTRVSAVDQATLDAWVTHTAEDAAARGVVGIVDFEMADNIGDWSRRFRAGFDAVRIAAGVYPDRLERAIADGHRTGDVIDGTAHRLSVGPAKVITDGSLNTRTAFCVEPYPGATGADAYGVLNVPADELVELLRRARSHGFTPAVHAIGDEANRLALDAFEAAGCGGRIEHAQLVRDQDFSRFAALGVAASVQPEHALDDRDIAELHWAGRTDRAFALRRLLDAGAELLMGSDAPVAPLDPWVTMAAAVSRTRDGREPWHPEQAIGMADAIRASTGGRDAVRVGDVADLVVTESDPLTASVDVVRSMPVAATFVAGYLTHDRL